jgi:hypothetical protein
MLLEFMHGSFEAGTQAAVELLPAARQIQDARFEGYALYGQAYCSLFRGDLDYSREMLDRTERLYVDEAAFTDEQFALNMYGLRALYFARLGDREQGLHNVREAEKLMGGAFQASWFVLPGYLTAAEACFHLWETGSPDVELREHAGSVVAGLGRYARTFPIGRPAHALYAGMQQFLTGKPARAQKTWVTALERSQGIMPYECGRLHLELVRRSVDLDPEVRRMHRDAALEMVRELGLSFELGMLESL